MPLYYALVFAILLVTHFVACLAGYFRGIYTGKLTGRLQEMKENVNFLKELDERWDSVIENTIQETEVPNYKDLN